MAEALWAEAYKDSVLTKILSWSKEAGCGVYIMKYKPYRVVISWGYFIMSVL